MTTALTVYETNTASTTLSTADLLATSSGASETSCNVTCGTATGYSEIYAQGTASAWQALGSIGAASGHGWLLDSTLLEGQEIVAGSWTPTARMKVSAGSITADIHVRAFKRSSAGVYTQIGSDMVLAAQSLTTTSATYTFSGTSQPATAFSTGDKLYIDVWLDITSNSTGSGTAQVNFDEGSSGTQGNITNEVVTPGYTPTTVTKDVAIRGKISQQVAKNLAIRGKISQISAKDIAIRAKISPQGSKDIAARAKVSQQSPKDVAIRAKVGGSRLLSGGFALFANGTGTASFDSFRVTHYPDPSLSLSAVGRAGTALVNWNALTPTNTSLTVATSLDNGVSWQSVTSAGGAISGIATQPEPVADTFTSNDSSSYTQSHFSGGTTGSWTWDTANSRLVGSGGTTGTLVYTTALTAADNQVMADLDQADGSGLIANYVDANDCYFVQIWDASGTGTQNAVKLFKRVGGVNTQLGTTVTISFTRGTYHRFILDVEAGVLTVSMDGTQLLQQTDGSPLGAGQAGFLLNTLLRAYSLRIQQYGQNVTALFLATKVTLSSTDPTATPQLLDMQAFVSSPDIGSGALVPSASYQGTFVSNNIDDQTKKSNYWWSVRSDKSAVFQAREASPAPFVLSSVNSQVIGGQTIHDVLLDGAQLSNSADLYRNRQTMKGAIATATFTETKTGDGQTRSWNVSYPLATPPTSFTLNGQPVSFGVKGVDTGRQFYYQIGSTAIDQDSSQTILQAADSWTLTYTGSYAQDVVLNNTGQFPGTISQSQMEAIATGTSGIVEAVQDVSSQAMTVAAATDAGNQLLQRYGTFGRTFQFKTLRSGLLAGQQLTLFVPEFNINDAQMLVTEVKVTPNTSQAVAGGLLYVWEVTATEAPNLGSWVKLFASVFNSTS